MFDKIQFQLWPVSDYWSQETIDAILDKDSDFSNITQSLHIISDMSTHVHRMSGLKYRPPILIKNFSVPPISQESKESLFYLKFFNIFYCGSSFYTERSSMDSYELFYTYRGNGQLTYRGKTYQLSEGDGFWIDCREPHIYHTVGDDWVFANITLDGPLLSKLYQQFSQNNSPTFTQGLQDFLQNHLEKMLNFYNTPVPYRDWQVSLCIQSFLTELLLRSIEVPHREPSLPQNMQYLIRYIENNYTENLTLDYLSHFFAISRSHMTRLFKKYTGYPPNEYLIQLRIEAAKRQLSSTKTPISEIAFTVGFKDINNFINLFKKNVGTTPSAYRKQQSPELFMNIQKSDII